MSIPSPGSWPAGLFACLLGAALAATLAGCQRHRPGMPPTPQATGESAPVPNAAASAVTPHSGDLPRTDKPAGPAEGGTAIGGMSANQDHSGAARGGAPAATAGDGAASAPRQ